MGIARHAIETLTAIAACTVKDVQVTPQGERNRLFLLEHPVKAYFRKDGRIELHLDVTIKNNPLLSVRDACLKIQEAVAKAVSSACETVPFSIDVKVVAVK